MPFAQPLSGRDYLIAALLAVIGAGFGVAVLLQNGWIHFYQIYSSEGLYWACGRGFGNTVARAPALTDFLGLRTTSFDCSSIDPAIVLGPTSVFTQSQLYLIGATAVLWKIFGVSYTALAPLVALLAAAYAGGCYLLIRQFFGRWFALAGAAVLALSPVALSMIVYFRDYAKGPFFIWVLLLVVVAMRAGDLRRTLMAAAGAGLVLGIGYGFRPDVVIMFPLGLAALLVGIGPRLWARRAGSAAVFAVAALLCASPLMIDSNRSGGGFGSLLMQGATDPFVRLLGVTPAAHSLGWRYSDELTLSAISADLRAADPAYDANEPQPLYGTSQSATKSGSYVMGWAHYFAGDFATRALKGAAWILGYPAFVSPAHDALEPAGPLRRGPPATHVLDWLYNVLGQPWLPWVGIAGLAAFFWRETARSPRQALALLIVTAVLLAYPVVQPSLRHSFHLEIYWVMALLALSRLPFERAVLAGAGRRFAISLAAVLALIGATYAGLVLYQDSGLRRVFGDLLALPRTPVEIAPAASDGGAVRFDVAVDERHKSIVEGPADGMKFEVWPLANAFDVRASADRMVLGFSAGCPAQSSPLTIVYSNADTAWQPLGHQRQIEIMGGGETEILFPAIYRATQHFTAIEMPESLAACVTGLERIEGSTPLPVILSADFPPGWQDGRLHQEFGLFDHVGTP